jgi:hypothetical protein
MNLASAFVRSRLETLGDIVLASEMFSFNLAEASEVRQHLDERHSLAPNRRNPVKRSSNCSATEHPPESVFAGLF